jgi:hypothetical protein
MFYPNTQADAILFNWWDEANPLSGGELSLVATASSGTVTDDDGSHNWLTSSAFPDGSVVKVIKGSDAIPANCTYHLVGTAGNNDRIIITPTSTWADEANIPYHIISYPARTAIHLIQPKDTNEYSMWVPFPGPKGFEFHNLVLETISSTCSAQLYLAHD